MQIALALINSQEWYGRGPDGLDDHLAAPGWLDRFLADWQLRPASPPSPRDQARLRRLRALLRRMFTALADGREPEAADLARLDGYLRAGALHRRIDPDGGYRVRLEAPKRDWAWVLSEIAASFTDLLALGERARIKVCQNPDCQWAFYDESKNRRRRWCSAAECGNVFKVRQFRARRRAQTTHDRG
jgi:predicted RNA-binding Zn ribbon-like protein